MASLCSFIRTAILVGSLVKANKMVLTFAARGSYPRQSVTGERFCFAVSHDSAQGYCV